MAFGLGGLINFSDCFFKYGLGTDSRRIIRALLSIDLARAFRKKIFGKSI